ncbi:DMT family transporter [Planctomonas deserti]|uniref:DMT family transporter n=1 Tax=Planctomonas deserti TaxID=2144185 RepID=UPI000D3D3526|nr:DMT family transporter [Planctomonas deserti]
MKAVVALVLATLMWAGNYVVGGIAVQSMTPVELTWFRWLLAAVPLLVLAQVIERPRWRAVLAEWPRLLILAVLGVLGYTLLLYSALQFTTPLSASLINAANPAVMAVLAAILLRERIDWRGALGLLLGLVGVILLITDGAVSTVFSAGLNPGDLLMIGAILVWSLYTILGRGLSAPPITATAVQAVLTVVLLAPVALGTGAQWPDRGDTVAALLFIAVFPSIGAYALWNLALTRIPPGRAGLFLNLITVFTVLISVLMGSRLTGTDIVGGLLVFAGVGLSSLRRRPNRRPPADPGDPDDTSRQQQASTASPA